MVSAGMCRLTSEGAVERVLAYSSEITVNGRHVELYAMYCSPLSYQPKNIIQQLEGRIDDEDTESDDHHYERDVIDPSEEGIIEATYHRMPRLIPKTKSTSMSQLLRPPVFSQNDFDSSSSSFIFQRPASNAASTETVSTRSTTELDDFDIRTAGMSVI